MHACTHVLHAWVAFYHPFLQRFGYDSDEALVAVSLKLMQRRPHELPPNMIYLLRRWLQSCEVHQVRQLRACMHAHESLQCLSDSGSAYVALRARWRPLCIRASIHTYMRRAVKGLSASDGATGPWCAVM